MRVLLLPILILVLSCRTTNEPPAPAYPPTPAANTSASQETLPIETLAELAEEPAPAAPPEIPSVLPVRIVAGEVTPLAVAKPTLRVSSPQPFQRIERGSVILRASVRNFAISEELGHHVELVFDNEPPIAIYDLRRAIDLGELLRTHLEHAISPGTHLVRMFPSLATHESVKTPGAFAAVAFSYGAPSSGFDFNARTPLLTYSQPSGCTLLSQRVLLDFYLSNLPALSERGYRVHYVLDHELDGYITEWAPHYIENLPAGEHFLRLELVDASSQRVAGDFNSITRSFTVDTACPEETPTVHELPATAAEHIDMQMTDRPPLMMDAVEDN